MANNQLREYYRKDAEQELKIQYQQEISDIKKNNIGEKERNITNAKQIINDQYIKLQKKTRNDHAEELKKEYVNIEKEFENIVETFDKETDKLTVQISEQKLIQNINANNFDNNEEYQKKVRDIIRNAKGNSRKIKQERRALRRNLINDIIELKQERKKEVKFEIDDKYNDIYETQTTHKNNSIKMKTAKIEKIWQGIFNSNITHFDTVWKEKREEKLQSIITQLIQKNKSRIINNSSNTNQSSILNMKKTLNDRLLNEWNMERKKKIQYKLRNIDSSIKELTVTISHKWQIQEQQISNKYDMELENKIQEIDNSIKTYDETTIQNYKTSILKNIEISKVEIDRNDFQTESEYTKKLRDEERQKQHELRKMRKELRKNKTIPDNIKKQLETYKKKSMLEKSNIITKYKQNKSNAIKNLALDKKNDIDNQIKKLTEKLTKKAEQEVDMLKESWISKKKEESILLNKVKDNNLLEIQLIQLNELLRSKNSTIIELREKIQNLSDENNKFKTEIASLNTYINKYKKDKQFVDKLKKKYMEKENLKEKKEEKIILETVKEENEEKTQIIAQQIKETENSLRTIRAKKKKSSKIISKVEQTNKKEMEKKLLMKMTLREKGPLFEHNYICTGIYRKETNFEILLKAKNIIITHFKFDYLSNFVNIITPNSNISLSCILEPDTYYEIIFTFNNKNVSISVNNNSLGTYPIINQILEDIIVRIKSSKSIFYHQYIKYIN